MRRAGWGPHRPYGARLLANTRVTAADHFQDVRHLEFDLGASGLTYEPGDLLAVFPQQRSEVVQQLLTRLHLDGTAYVKIRPNDAAGKAPSIVVCCCFHSQLPVT